MYSPTYWAANRRATAVHSNMQYWVELTRTAPCSVRSSPLRIDSPFPLRNTHSASQAKRSSPLLFSNIYSESISFHSPCAVYRVSFFKSHRKFEALQCCEVVVSMTHWWQIRCWLRCKCRISWWWACSCPWMIQEVKVFMFRDHQWAVSRFPQLVGDPFPFILTSTRGDTSFMSWYGHEEVIGCIFIPCDHLLPPKNANPC